jgi:hypothetical protein
MDSINIFKSQYMVVATVPNHLTTGCQNQNIYEE